MMALSAAADRSDMARPHAGGLLQQPDAADSSTQDSTLIALPPTGTTNLFASTGRQHDDLDLALRSLVDEGLEFLSS
jgi:hypothetical protein